MVADDLSHRLDAAAVRITRFADDAYRAAVVSGAVTQALDNATPVEAAAQAWRELSAKGITGFTDKSGRNWNLASYVEMATRTATQRAYNASHRDRRRCKPPAPSLTWTNAAPTRGPVNYRPASATTPQQPAYSGAPAGNKSASATNPRSNP
jgi:predicted amidohydrolase YtcJ